MDFETIKDFISEKKRLLIIIASGVCFLALLIGGYFLFFVKDNNENINSDINIENEVEVVDENCQNARNLDGLCVEAGQEKLPVYGVMIENALDARPQFGVAKANLVFEAIAEGGITRFLVLYDSSFDIKKIGPVRSARKYFLEWAQEFRAVHAHIGGSPEALELAKTRPIYDLDEFSNQYSFWRANDRAAPHNVFTSTELLTKAVLNKNWQIEPNYESWLYKDDAPLSERPVAQTIDVDFNSYYYSIQWKYNQETNDYTRFQGGAIHRDSDGSSIKTKNIAVMYVTSYVIAGDDKGRRFTQTVGEGKAFVLLDGRVIPGNWKRADLNSRTRFFDEVGQEIKFNRGTAWVEVLPKGFLDIKVTE